MKRTSAKAELSSKQLFLRSMMITLILAAAVLVTVFGAAKAYTAIRKNGFGEQTKAIDIEQTSSGTRVKLFDYEGEVGAVHRRNK